MDAAKRIQKPPKMSGNRVLPRRDLLKMNRKARSSKSQTPSPHKLGDLRIIFEVIPVRKRLKRSLDLFK